MKYYDVFGEHGYHSAFLTTFSFTAQAFEDIPFSKLRAAGCRNVCVLADQSMLNLSVEEFGTPRFAGSLYHLAKVDVPGAFHPKITLLLGEKKGRLLVGSANLTALGIAGNKELVADLRFTPEEPSFAPLFRQAFEYIESYAPRGDPWFPIARERALERTPWLVGEVNTNDTAALDGLALVLDAPTEPVLDQVTAAIGDDEIKRLVVLSPYWDRELEGLRRLREALGTPTTHVLLEKGRAEFPTRVFQPGAGIELFDIEENGRSRFNHAKLIVAHGKAWDHVFSGSVNCTVPALLGRFASRGNAEAAIYKRVAAGSALARLGLESYLQAPIEVSSLTEPEIPTSDAQLAGPAEAGIFQLRGNKVTWSPPKILRGEPRGALLFDQFGENIWGEFASEVAGETSWHVEFELKRPRSARVLFENGELSAVSMIIDIDALAPSTLPTSSGRKSKLADKFLEASSEDLELVGYLAELEMMDLDGTEVSNAKFHEGKGAKEEDDSPQTYFTLTYDDFVKARERADAAREKGGHLGLGRGNRAADLVSSCLNRLIGLVSRDISGEEDAELRKAARQDPSAREPGASPGEGAGQGGEEKEENEQERRPKKRSRERVSKIVEAVAAFEARTKDSRGKPITTTELVRLRLLLQVVLNYAEPLRGEADGHGFLQVSDNLGHGWPRLLGRLLMQHFGTFLALQHLRLEEDENEQLRVLEYLATAYFASQAALQGLARHPKEKVLKKPIERLASGITQQMALFVKGHEDDQEYVRSMLAKLEGRFGEKLGLSSIPPLPELT